jgi:fumarylpyruvate hydrolase
VKLAIPAREIPTLPIVGSNERIPVRRVCCTGLNYLDHKREMGGHDSFFFATDHAPGRE